jgi:hypothetical protein
MFIKTMKIRLVCILLLIFPLLSAHAWFAAQVYYSDFQWLDDERLLVLRTLADDGAAGSFSEILILNTRDGSYLPLTPFIKGYACSLAGNKLFVHTDRDIIMYDFDKGPSPVPQVVFNLKPQDFSRIEDLRWLAEGKLVFDVFSDYHGMDRIVFDYIGKRQTAFTHISEEEYNHLFEKRAERFLFKNYSQDTGYVVQVSANREYDSARKEADALKAHHPCIVYEDNYYKVFIGFFDFEKQAQQQLANRRKNGYAKAFVLSRQSYELRKVYDGRAVSLMVDRSGIWYKKGEVYLPVFESAENIAPIAVYGDLFLFLKNTSLFALNLKGMTVQRLSICLHERMNYGVSQPVAFWDAASGSVIFPHVAEDGRSYWTLKADGGGLEQLEQGSAEYGRYKNARPEYSLEKLEGMASGYQNERRRNTGRETAELNLPAHADTRLVVHFFFCDCCWANSLSLKNANGERALLPSVRNW